MVNATVLFFFLATTIIALSLYWAPVEAKNIRKAPKSGVRKLTTAEIKKHPRHPSRRNRSPITFVPDDNFNASQKWPNCPSISTIRDQGQCGTCWAVSSASVIADRLCIASNNTDFISSSQIAGCTYPTASGSANCLNGGNPADAFKFVVGNGIASGGEYNSNQGCVPYNVPNCCDTPDITCSTSCTNTNYDQVLTVDTTSHRISSYWIDYDSVLTTQENIDKNVLLMQKEIFENGPIEAIIEFWTDFQYWNGGAPYPGPSANATTDGYHAVRISGWGKTDDGVRYWTIANSWGTDLGLSGYYWVEMGKNVISIEGLISAPVVTATSG